MVLSWNKNLKLGIDVIRLFGNSTLHVSLTKKNCKICSIYDNIINTQSFYSFFETHDHHFSADEQNVVFSFLNSDHWSNVLKKKNHNMTLQ